MINHLGCCGNIRKVCKLPLEFGSGFTPFSCTSKSHKVYYAGKPMRKYVFLLKYFMTDIALTP